VKQWANLGILLLVTAAALPAEPVPLTGQVVGPDGKGVAGAEVWVIRQTYVPWDSVTLARGKTDDEGRFRLADVEGLRPQEKPWSIYVACLAPGFALGWVRWDGEAELQAALQRGELRFALATATPLEGLVRDAEGHPLPGVTVTPTMIHETATPQGQRWDRPVIYPGEELGRVLATTSGADGRFALAALPAACQLSYDLEAPGYGKLRGWTERGKSWEVRLGRAGRLEGRLVCADEPTATAGVEVRYVGSSNGLDASGQATTDENGRFVFPEIPPGTYLLTVQYDPARPWQALPLPDVTVEPGATRADLEIPFQRGVLVTGEVRDEADEKPIVGVELYAALPCVGGQERSLGRTDAEGRFRFYTLPGQADVRVFTVPEAYVPPEYLHQEVTVEGPEEVALEPFYLKKAVTLAGVTVNAKGKPIPGADIYVFGPRSHLWNHAPLATSDANGRFQLTRLDPDEAVELRARTETAMTMEGVRLRPWEAKEPVRLALREGVGCRVRGRVVDDVGQPIAGATVQVWRYQEQSTHWELTLLTDGDGRYESPPLWPMDGYHVEAEAPQHRQAESEKWPAKPGETHTFADLVLTKAGGFLAGVVVDATGQPVGGVRVFNNGDAAEPLETVTDADGRFRLEGLFPGFAYAFAEAPGYRLAGIRAETGAENLRLVLRKAEEPLPAVEPPPLPPADFERDRQLAKELIEKGWELTKGTKFFDREGWVRGMAQLDEDRAFEMSAEEGDAYDAAIYGVLVPQVAATDVEEALAYAEEVTRYRHLVLLDAARRILDRQPEEAARLLEESVLAAQGEEPAWRTAHLAMAAAAMMKCREEVGREWLEEARQTAEKLGYTGPEAYARGVVAENLCRWDDEAAWKLVEPIQDDEYDRHLANMAHALAAERPDRAVELLGKMRNRWARAQASVKVGYVLAAVDLDKAVELAERLEQQNDQKSLAYGYLAQVAAEKDRARALELLERAVELQIAEAQGNNYFNNFTSPAILVARLAQIGRDVGYPDVSGLALRALALRFTAKQTFDPKEVQQANAALAFCLAWADPEAARGLLEPMVAAFDPKKSRYRFDTVIWTLAALDPPRAAEFVLNLPDDDPTDEIGPKARSLLQLANFLLTDPAQRRDAALARYGFWVPGVSEE